MAQFLMQLYSGIKWVFESGTQHMQKSEVTSSGDRQNFLPSEKSDSSLTMKPKEELDTMQWNLAIS